MVTIYILQGVFYLFLKLFSADAHFNCDVIIIRIYNYHPAYEILNLMTMTCLICQDVMIIDQYHAHILTISGKRKSSSSLSTGGRVNFTRALGTLLTLLTTDIIANSSVQVIMNNKVKRSSILVCSSSSHLLFH